MGRDRTGQDITKSNYSKGKEQVRKGQEGKRNYTGKNRKEK